MSIRKFLAALVLTLIAVAPVSVSAASLADIQAQIKALLAQLATLQTQQAMFTTTQATSTGGLSATIDSTNPLLVTFKYTMNQERSCNGGSYRLHFGDSGLGEELHYPADACNAYVQYTTHTYASAGTYTATLYDRTNSGERALGTATITVGGGNTSGTPSCTIYSNPETAVLGDRVTIKWESVNATRARWIRDTSGKDNLTPPAGRPGLKGTKTITMNVSGNPSLTLAVYGARGASGSCTVVIPTDDAGTDDGDLDSGDGIRVTAPNGGERWEIGQTNTITWAPYQYAPDVNPAKDVSVYLKRVNGSVVGRVMDTGKASLHTYFNINEYDKWAEPGQYYVQVKNNRTGETDVSDAPFTLLSRAVDVKVNGSDGPITLSDNEPVTVSLVTNDVSSCTISGVRTSPGGSYSYLPIKPNTTSKFYYAFAPAGGGSTAVSVTCYKNDGGARGDSVGINISSASASLKISSPNGGETLAIGKPYDITWSEFGANSASIALYKDNKWFKWIATDLGINDGKQLYSWTPGGVESEAAPLGSVFKIYITGQKSDGSGYVDDKSDTTFSFSSTASTKLGIYRGYMNGNLFITTQEISEADALANCKTNAANNPTKSVYCTWNEKEIYSGKSMSAPTCTVSASNTVIAPGEKTKITWTSKNAVSVSGKGVGQDEFNSSMYVMPTESSVYDFVFTGSTGAKVTCSQRITVENPETPATPAVFINASPTSIEAGQGTYISWKSTNAQRCTLQYGNSEESVGTSGGRTFYPYEKTAYRLICANDPGTGKDGPTADASVTVYVETRYYQPTNGSLEQASESQKQNLAAALSALLQILKNR